MCGDDKITAKGIDAVTVYLNCLCHLEKLMKNGGKMKEFKELFSNCDKNGFNITLKMLHLANVHNGYSKYKEIVKFIVGMNLPINYTNWNYVVIEPHTITNTKMTKLLKLKYNPSPRIHQNIIVFNYNIFSKLKQEFGINL